LSLALFGGAAGLAVYSYVPSLRPAPTVRYIKPGEIGVSPEFIAAEAIAAAPGELAGYNLLIEQSKGLDACIAKLEQVCEENPTFATPFSYLCQKYAKRGDFESVEDTCTRCAELRPDDPQPLMALAGLAITRRNLDEAIEIFRQQLEAHPDLPFIPSRLP